MAHLQHVKLDYSALFDIDQTWTWKDFVLAVRGTFERIPELVEAAPGFARVLWLKALGALVGFLSAMGQDAYMLDEGLSSTLWLLWKGVVYPLVYLMLVQIYVAVWSVSVVLWCAMGGTQDGEWCSW